MMMRASFLRYAKRDIKHARRTAAASRLYVPARGLHVYRSRLAYFYCCTNLHFSFYYISQFAPPMPGYFC